MILFKRHCMLLFVLLLMSECFFAQGNSFNTKDSLSDKSYEYLKKQIELSEEDTVKLQTYLDFFVRKARKDNNQNELYHYYNYYLFYQPNSKHLPHADSAIYYAKTLKDNALIGDAYYSKGVVYFFRKHYKESLDTTLEANDYIQKTNDNYLKTKIKYKIANIKVYLGFYEEAIVLFQECIAYFGQHKDYNNQKGLVNSYDGLSVCYIRSGKYDMATQIITLGIQTAKSQGFDFDVQYFAKTQGINEYFKEDYSFAIQLLQQALPTIIENEDISAETTSYFYLGKSFLKLKQDEKAMDYFFKVDNILADSSFITPELRENYEILIDYYKKHNNVEKQLEFVNKLIDADKVLNQNYKYLLGKIHKEYDTENLIQAKNILEAQLSQQKASSWVYIGVTSVLIVSLGLFILFYYKKQRLYKERFEVLMRQVENKKVAVKSSPKAIGIHQEVIDDVLKKIEKFEKEQQFLKKGLTLGKVADQFKTNSKYLSKIINHYRGNNFSTYLNVLRIEYTIDLLKTERVTQKYTIKALGEMTGFATTQHFSDAFQIHTGLRPSYFIEELGKSQLRIV